MKILLVASVGAAAVLFFSKDATSFVPLPRTCTNCISNAATAPPLWRRSSTRLYDREDSNEEKAFKIKLQAKEDRRRLIQKPKDLKVNSNDDDDEEEEEEDDVWIASEMEEMAAKVDQHLHPKALDQFATDTVADADAQMQEQQPASPASPLTMMAERMTFKSNNLLYDSSMGRFYEMSSEKQLPLDLLWERAVDTVEDAVVHARRVPYENGWLPQNEDRDKKNKIPTVVVLGSGWAAHALVKVADTNKMRLIVVSPTNHFVFTPMLASAAVGTVEYRSMTEAIRASNPMMENYIEGKAVNVNVQDQTLTVQCQSLLEETRSGQPPLSTIHYDKLVVAVGCKVLDSIVPGAAQYCYKLKTCEDARKLRRAVGECLEFASRLGVAAEEGLRAEEAQARETMRRKRLTWVIVGGGPTGVELAGELHDFVQDVTKDRVGAYKKLQNEIQIVLVQGGSALVPSFEPKLRAAAFDSLTKAGIDVRLNTYVKEVGDGWIQLQHKDGGDVETIDFGFSVWAAGITPALFVETLLSKLPEAARGSRGRVNVDRWLRCPTPTPETFGSIMVMGDAAAFATKEIDALPQTAQVAAQQGAFVARMLNRGYNLTTTPPVLGPDGDTNDWLRLRGLEEAAGFQFLNLGILAYLGQGKALSQIDLGDVPIASYAGSVAFMLWRSVYLVKQVATRNRILVLFDWAKCKVFGRDTTRL